MLRITLQHQLWEADGERPKDRPLLYRLVGAEAVAPAKRKIRGV
jgi:hypothetical protein